MKLLVVGLDGASPELLLEDESLPTIRRLMESGCYGPLESVIPPITVPAWACMATSQDPGSLGIYGFRNRTDDAYHSLTLCDSTSIRELAVWDQVAREGKRSVVIGVPPGYPPRRINGVWVGCLLTPDPSRNVFTHPPEVCQQIHDLVSDYPVDVKGFRTENKQWLRDEIYRMSRKHFRVVRHLLATAEWDYFQFVEIGLDRMHHGFWRYHDRQHVVHEPGNPLKGAIRDYYRYLDEELGALFELLSEDTAVVVVSDHGAKRMDGGLCINEWLIQQGLLKLHTYPDQVTPLNNLSVNWERTRAWAEGGHFARIFLNVRGREPSGIVAEREYERLRDEIRESLEAVLDPSGNRLGNQVFKPEEIYRTIRGRPPDLIAHLGGLRWRSIGSVGHGRIHVSHNDAGADDCNHSEFGVFILAASNSSLRGRIEGTHILDIAPTLLELGGYDVPPTMQGRSLLPGRTDNASAAQRLSQDEGDEVLDRLRGLGYL